MIFLLQDYLYVAPLHIHLAATKSMATVISNGTLPAYVFANSVLPIILHIVDNKDNGEMLGNTLLN